MIDEEKNVQSDYRSCLVIIVLFIILVPTMSIINYRMNSSIEYTYFMDVIETDSYMGEPEKIVLDEEGNYESDRFDDTKIKIYDNSSRVLYYMNLKERIFDKVYNSRDLGTGYHYNNKLYKLSGHSLKIEEKGSLIANKRLFSANIESDVYIDNIGVVSLKVGGIRGINLDTRKIVWSNSSKDLGNHINFLVHEKDIYYTNSGNLIKLNYKTGEEVMVRKLQPSGDGDRFPLVVDGTYIYTGGNFIHKVDFNTWRTINKIEINPKQILFDEDYIYVSTSRFSNELYKIDKSTFDVIWYTKLYDGARIELLDEYICIENTNDEVALINKESGEFVWSERIENEYMSSIEAYGQEQYLVVVKPNGEIFYYDTTTLKNND